MMPDAVSSYAVIFCILPDIRQASRDCLIVRGMRLNDFSSVSIYYWLPQKVHKVQGIIHLLQEISLEVLPASLSQC